MESIKIKEEPLDIKQEPLDHPEFDENLLVPLVSLVPKVEVTDKQKEGDSLSCPKCDIRYYSAMSIKNHIQVCKKVQNFITHMADA